MTKGKTLWAAAAALAFLLDLWLIFSPDFSDHDQLLGGGLQLFVLGIAVSCFMRPSITFGIPKVAVATLLVGLGFVVVPPYNHPYRSSMGNAGVHELLGICLGMVFVQLLYEIFKSNR